MNATSGGLPTTDSHLSYLPMALVCGASELATLMILLVIFVYRKWVNQNQVSRQLVKTCIQ